MVWFVKTVNVDNLDTLFAVIRISKFILRRPFNFENAFAPESGNPMTDEFFCYCRSQNIQSGLDWFLLD